MERGEAGCGSQWRQTAISGFLVSSCDQVYVLVWRDWRRVFDDGQPRYGSDHRAEAAGGAKRKRQPKSAVDERSDRIVSVRIVFACWCAAVCVRAAYSATRGR